ncbi:MAG: aldehyde ferredoxin oxidoreductase N-terminal domain-containing protein [Acidobacteriota bacterium]|nr:aldehyde ferredoxin oxidoreductase N-terminal domain-containing protein [Acidobacteriota bacterium]
MSFGWCGQLLFVDLTRGVVTRESLDPQAMKDAIGARGLATELYLRNVAVDADAENEHNALVFAASPLTGTLMPNGGHYSVVTRTASGLVHANLGGAWGPQLKYAGFDAVIVRGKASGPVYLWIHDGEAELRDALELWGQGTTASVSALREATDEKARVCCIGPAGEHGLSMAALVTDALGSAAAPGMAALLGRKFLKAIVVRGTHGIRLAKAAEFMSATQELRKRSARTMLHAKGARLNGPVFQVTSLEEDANALPSEGLRPRGCFGCAAIFSTFTDQLTGETLASFGRDSLPHINRARLLEYHAFTDLGLDYVRAKACLAHVERKEGEDEFDLAVRLAHGQLNGAATEESVAQGAAGGCAVGGFVLVPALKTTSIGQENGVDAAALAAAESAGCCPFAAAAMPPEEIAHILTSATGIEYSPEDVLRAGRRLATATGK